MKMILRFALAFACAGFCIAFVSALLGGVYFLSVLLRALLCALLGAGLGICVYTLLRKKLPESLQWKSAAKDNAQAQAHKEDGEAFYPSSAFTSPKQKHVPNMEEKQNIEDIFDSAQPSKTRGQAPPYQAQALSSNPAGAQTYGQHTLLAGMKSQYEPKIMAEAVRTMIADEA